MAADEVVVSTELAAAIEDGFPISPGHVLIVPRRHVRSVFDLSPEELTSLTALTEELTLWIREEQDPAGFNIGLNEGFAAGQTIQHVHIHVIPRYEGDVPDPRGGVRWVIPERARYWSTGG